jgi:hypothetical protein
MDGIASPKYDIVPNELGFPPSRIFPSMAPVGHPLVSVSTSFDPVPALTPVSEDSTIPGSSLLTGLSPEEPSLPIPVSFGGTDPTSSSSFLAPFTVGSATYGGSSIWGDSGSQSIIPSLGSTPLPIGFGSDDNNHNNNKITWSSGDNQPLWDVAGENVSHASPW